ncbi:oligoendopeptidase F [Mycoplasmoides genitalium]
MKNSYKWDLSVLLNNQSLQANFLKIQTVSEALIKAYNNGLCFTNKTSFEQFLAIDDKFTELENRYTNYLYNKQNENNLDKEVNDAIFAYQSFKNNHNLAFSTLQQELYNHEKLIKDYLTDPKLAVYKRNLMLVFRDKPHQLSSQTQSLLSQINPCFNQAERIFNILSTADLNLQPVVYQNKKYPINSVSDYQSLLENTNRGIRKACYEKWIEIYWTNRNSLSLSLVENYIQLENFAKLKNHPSYIAQTAFNDEIEVGFIDFVYQQVAQFAKTFQAFIRLKKQIYKHVLKVNKVEPYDLTLTLFKTKKPYTIEQAKQDALKVLDLLGDNYIKIVKKAFNENWIDWLADKNKYTGAYSISNVKGLEHFFILMNFDKTKSSLNTLVHELGHSVHSWYASQHQSQNIDPTIFYAEIASIANELLLCYYELQLYKNNHKQLIASLLSQINHFFGATTRQIMFSQFEKDTLDLIRVNQKPDFKTLIKIYANTAVKYQGFKLEVVANKLKKTQYQKSLSHIIAIPHFYAGNFYVYKYAIGQVAGILVAKKINSGDKKMKDNYFKFLSSGSSLAPLETIKLLGIDLTSPQPWQEAHNEVKRWLKIVKQSFKKLQK